MTKGTVEIAYNFDYSLEKLKQVVRKTPGLRLAGQRSWPSTDKNVKRGENTE